jgi:hypothetical protein
MGDARTDHDSAAILPDAFELGDAAKVYKHGGLRKTLLERWYQRMATCDRRSTRRG